jgi:hypothetical protein
MVLSGCRSAKIAPVNDGTLNLTSATTFFAAYSDNVFQYRTLSARIQFDFVTPQGNSTSARGQLKILKDEGIQISITVPILGIEAVRAELTPDSVKIINRLNRWYMVDAFDQIKGDTEIDFNYDNLQALLTNRLFLPGETDPTNASFNRFGWESTRTGHLVRTNDRSGLAYTFSADLNAKIIAAEIKDTTSNYRLDYRYENFQLTGRQLFPVFLYIRLLTEQKDQYALSLNLSRIEVDTPVTMEFPIPVNYQRVTLEQIIQSIEQL